MRDVVSHAVNGARSGCSSAEVVWDAFVVDPRSVHYSWRLCDETGARCPAGGNVVAANRLPLGRGRLSLHQDDVTLIPGLRYYSTVNATACDASSVAAPSAGFVCDDSPPRVLDANGVALSSSSAGPTAASAAAVGGLVTVVWDKAASVFDDAESGLASFEVCLGWLYVPCRDWQPAGFTFHFIVQPVPASLAGPGGEHVVAHVRALNAVGAVSLPVESNPLRLFSTAPTMARLAVQGQDEVTLNGTHCYLTSTNAVHVQWAADEQSFTPGGGVYAFGVERIHHYQTVAVVEEALVGTSLSTAVALRGTADGDLLRFRAGMLNDAGMRGEGLSLDCTVDTSAPAAGEVFVVSGRPALRPRPHLYAHLAATRLVLCWRAFSEPHSAVASYEYSVQRAMDDGGGSAPSSPAPVRISTDLSARVAAEELANATYIPPRSALFGPGAPEQVLHCAQSDIALAVAETYVAHVVAINAAGLKSQAASVTVLTDRTPPQFSAANGFTPPTAVQVHTGSANGGGGGEEGDVHRQISSCCLRLSWPTAYDAELLETAYSVCFEGGACLELGTATRVLLMDGSCPCLAPVSSDSSNPASPSDWLSVTAGPFPMIGGQGGEPPQIRLALYAENALGLRSEVALAVVVDATPPAIHHLAAMHPARPATSLDSSASCQPGGHHHPSRGEEEASAGATPRYYLSAGAPLRLSWSCNATEVAHFDACLVPAASDDSAGEKRADCRRQATDRAVTFHQLEPGRYVASVTAESTAGAVGPTAQLSITVDGTPPQMGVLVVGDDAAGAAATAAASHEAAFWAQRDSVSFHWSGVSDDESGIISYEAQLIREAARCAPKSGGGGGGGGSSWVDGTVAATSADAFISCNASRSHLVTRLVHGASYHVVLTAINGAGMTSRLFSKTFVADLFNGIDSSGLTFLEPPQTSELSFLAQWTARQLDPFDDTPALGLYSPAPPPPPTLYLPPALPPSPPSLPPLFAPSSPPNPQSSQASPSGSAAASRRPAAANSLVVVNALSPLESVHFDLVLLSGNKTFNTSATGGNATEQMLNEVAERIAPTADELSNAPAGAASQGRILQLNHSVPLRSATSVCCDAGAAPAAKRVVHDGWLSPAQPAAHFGRQVALAGRDHVLVAADNELVAVQLAQWHASGDSAAFTAHLQELLKTISLECALPSIALSGSASFIAVYSCGTLYSLAIGVAFDGATYRRGVVSKMAFPGRSDVRLHVGSETLFIFSISTTNAPPGSYMGQVHSLPLAPTRFTDWTSLQPIQGGHRVSPGDCLGCVSAAWTGSGSVLAVGVSHLSSSSDGCGVIAVYESPNHRWTRSDEYSQVATLTIRGLQSAAAATTSAAAGGGGSAAGGSSSSDGVITLGAQACREFGSVVHVSQQLLAVGLPSANDGAGVVAVYSLPVLGSPSGEAHLLCVLTPPEGGVGFGHALASRVHSSGALLLSVSMGGAHLAAVHRVALASSGPMCDAQTPATVISGPPGRRPSNLTSSSGDEGGAALVFAPHGVVIGFPSEPSKVPSTTTGALSFTAYCEAGHAKGAAYDDHSATRRSCLPCAPGTSSLGGLAHECDHCAGTVCALPHQTVFNVTLDASAAELVSGDVVKLRMLARSKAVRGRAAELTSDEGAHPEVLIDLSPPVMAKVHDALPCNFTNSSCRSSPFADVATIPAGRYVQAWWETPQEPHTQV